MQKKMQKNRNWLVAPLVALLLNLAAVGALADPITPTAPITSTTTTTVTATAAPSVTTTTGTTVPSTTVQVPLPTPTPIIQIITTQPITIDTTTVLAPTTSTPLGGSVTVGGPGTTGSVPFATNVGPIATLTLNPLPDITSTVTLPAMPTVTTSGVPAVSTDGSDFANLSNATAIGEIRTFTIDPDTGQVRYTTVSGTVTEPANGVSVNASATAAVCLLASVVGRTTIDPAAKAYLTTLCSDSPSTASGTAGAKVGDLASGSVDAAASICVVANALAIPSQTISTAYLASLGLDTRCGTGTPGPDQPLGPSKAGLDFTATALNYATVDGRAAAAICLVASAIAGVPTTADLATACGAAAAGSPDPTLTPSLLSGGLNATTPVGDLNGGLAAALCVVAHAVADLPTTATLTTACGTVAGQSAAPVSGGTPDFVVTTMGGDIGSIDPLTLEPSSGVQIAGTALRNDNALTGILGQLGITSLPGTSTVLGGGLLGFALIGLGVAFLRRRQPATA